MIVLQVLLNQDGSIEMTDGRDRVHLNYGKEEKTLTLMNSALEILGFEDDCLDKSYFSCADISFECFWNSTKKELIVSIQSMGLRLVDTGLGHSKPEKTFYITQELSVRRVEILKRKVMAKKVRKIEVEIDMDELFNPVSTGGIIELLTEEQGPSDNDGDQEPRDNTPANPRSAIGITPCKSDAPSATVKQEEACFEEHHMKRDHPVELLDNAPLDVRVSQPGRLQSPRKR